MSNSGSGVAEDVNGGGTKVSGTMLKLLLQVEQLKEEAALRREPVSKTAQDLADYCDRNKSQDHLLNGIDPSLNPFIEKSKCCTIQ